MKLCYLNNIRLLCNPPPGWLKIRRTSRGKIFIFMSATMVFFGCSWTVDAQPNENAAEQQQTHAFESLLLATRKAESLAAFASKKALKSSNQALAVLANKNNGKPGYLDSMRSDGLYYRGQTVKIPPNLVVFRGLGAMSWPNNNNYVGQFTNGHMNGYGVFRGGNHEIYQGEWRQGKMNGYGVLSYPDGAKFEGTFVDGRRNGYGVQINSDGERYQGEWREDITVGYGIRFKQNRGIEYVTNP